MREISLLTEELLPPQEGLCSMQLVGWLVGWLVVCLFKLGVFHPIVLTYY